MKELTASANAEIIRARQAVYAIDVVGMAIALIVWLNWQFLQEGWIGYVFWGWLGIIAGVSLFVMLRSWDVGQGYVSRAAQVYFPQEPSDFTDAESTPLARELPAQTLPALPADEMDEVIPFKNSRGEVSNIPRNLIRGFDPRDVEFLARQLARGFKFTEAAMEKLELPYSHEVMGKAQENTAYTRWMEWCCEALVIVGRDGKKSGTLAILEAPEIVQALKAAA